MSSLERLNFNHVFYFHVVAEEGSVSRAAVRLRVTKPTVSEQVRELEAALGVKLFHRRGGRLELTSEGRSALASTRRMFSAATSLVERFAGSAEREVLRVGVSSSVSRALTADFFRPLFGTSGFRVILRTATGEVLPRALVDGDLDLAITDTVPLEPGRRGLVTETLVRSRVVVVTGGDAEGLPDRAVLPIRGSALRRAANDYLARIDGDPIEVLGETDDVPSAISLAEGVPCLAFVPERGAVREIRAGTLRVVEVLPLDIEIAAVFVERDRVIERIRRAIDMLRDGGDPPGGGGSKPGSRKGERAVRRAIEAAGPVSR
ncbi:MAG: LysR family transcriptional regulator [Sandaracinaceae bacterium]